MTMINLHLDFLDKNGTKLETPFILMNNYPLLPRKDDTMIFDIEANGFDYFIQGYDLISFDDYFEFFDCFSSKRFAVAAIELESHIKAPIKNSSHSFGLVLQNDFDAEKYEVFIKDYLLRLEGKSLFGERMKKLKIIK